MELNHSKNLRMNFDPFPEYLDSFIKGNLIEKCNYCQELNSTFIKHRGKIFMGGFKAHDLSKMSLTKKKIFLPLAFKFFSERQKNYRCHQNF